MHTTPGRILIGAAVGFAGLLTLPSSTTRWAAFAVWVVAWSLLVVAREARNERRAAAQDAYRVELEAAVAEREAALDAADPGRSSRPKRVPWSVPGHG